MYKYDSKTNRWRDKKGRFVSEKRVPLRYTFYYDSRVKRYRDTKTGKYISKEKVLKFVEDNNLGKINVLSKSGKLYRDNKIIDRLIKDVYTDLKVEPEIKKYPDKTRYTFEKEITDLDLVFFTDYSWEYTTLNELTDYTYNFFKVNHLKKNKNVRLYSIFWAWVYDEKVDQERERWFEPPNVTQMKITKENIKEQYNIMKEDHEDRIRKEDYREKILEFRAWIILKEWD